MPKLVPPSSKLTAVWLSSRRIGPLADLVPSVTTGVVTGIINIILAISLAALIFAGDLSPFVAGGIGLFLLGGSIAIIVTALVSSLSGTITAIQDAPAAILAVAIAVIVQTLPPTTTPQETFITVVVAVALTSLLTGFVFLLVGHFKLGALMRFLPYPVVGGFLAGTGWLLVTGGIGVMTDLTFDLTRLAPLFTDERWLRWVPGLLLAAVMLVVLNRYHHVLLLPSMLIGATGLFYLVMWLSGTSLERISAERWLAGPFPSGGLWRPFPFDDLVRVHWGAIIQHSSELTSILLVSVVSLLLNVSGVEFVIKRDLDLNRELRAAGWGTMVSGLLGGLICFHALTDITLNYRAAKGRRLTAWITALVGFLTLFFGAALLAFVPKFVLGSMLVLLGLGFLYEWVYLAWFKFQRIEYLIILIILTVSATGGYLLAVQIGLLAAVALFVVNYSRVNVVRHALSGTEAQSRVSRRDSQRQVLEAHGDELYILHLQGYLFFGTAHNLLERVRQRVAEATVVPLRFVLLDFDQVTGLDSTAVLSFLKMKDLAEEQQIALLITHPARPIQQQLEHGGFIDKAATSVMLFPDVDHGLEWCENRILARVGSGDIEMEQTLQAAFQEMLVSASDAIKLMHYLEAQQVAAGAYLIQEGAAPDYVYFLATGQLTARLDQSDAASVRLGTIHAGHVVGEIGFYLGQERTAAVVADEPSTVYRLSISNLQRMEREAPDTAAAFHRMIALLLAKRVAHLVVVVDGLQRKA